MKTAWRLLVQSAAAALLFCAVSAKDGRDFAGFYQVSDVVEMGDTVVLTFTVDVYNFSDEDVLQAQVVLSDWLDLEAYGSASDISIAGRGMVRIQGEVEVDAHEYERWHVGASPFLYIEFQDPAGNSIRSPVELLRSLLRGEES